MLMSSKYQRAVSQDVFIFRAVFVATAIAFANGLCVASTPSKIVRYTNPRTYDIEHSVVVTNDSSVLTSLEMWIPVAQNHPEQAVRHIKITPNVPIFRDPTGTAAVAKLFMTKDLPAEGQSVSLKVSYELTAREVIADKAALARYPYKPYRKNKTYVDFTRKEKKIEIDLPEITSQAALIKAEQRSAVSIARAAYDWVLERTSYKLIEGFGGAAYCLRKCHGECGDYSALFVALCRAAGIPARPVTGFWADKTDSWHVWAEFMLPSGEWIAVDCSLGDQSEKKREYYFGSLDNRRVALCKTFDVVLAEARTGKKEIDFLQTGAWWWYASKIGRPPTAKFTAQGQPVQDTH